MSERVLRCAIYTRKSTEEGLEQDFNTLHAQQEAAEAYIRSQAQLGWKPVDRLYADGGFTGANLDRPALKLLLADIENGRIDCVVVYKVDRLSRSLLDFSKLVALFDRYKVSFVSVTQEFNTTTSLGRLTLNILLSFAQFEREIIGERTRDKLSAARKKGKWIGGRPVLGYDIDKGRLVVNPSEAERVQEIFALCDQAGSLAGTLEQVHCRAILTKGWTSGSGRQRCSHPFSKSTLSLLLSNVLYKGCVRHKGVEYPGEQPAIVAPELWERVNQRLSLNAGKLRGHRYEKQEAPLAGLLVCSKCHGKLIATYTRKNGKRYQYYHCGGARKGECDLAPLAALDIETSLQERLSPMLGDRPSNLEVRQTIDKIIFDSDGPRVEIAFNNKTKLRYDLPVAYGRRARIEENQGRVPRISRLMALSIKLEALVRDRTVQHYQLLASAGHISRARLSHILSLVNLAPSIQEALLFLPTTKVGADMVTERDLRPLVKVVDWTLQERAFQGLLKMAMSREGR